MTNLVSFLKRIRVKQLLIVCVAGVMLFFTQACSAGAATPSSQNKTGANSQTYVPKGDGINNAYEGGMNKFSDTDPRAKDLNSAQTKAKALVDNAQSNITSHMDSPNGILNKTEEVEDIGKKVKRGAEDVTDKAADSASDFVKGTKRGFENIKNNTADAVDNVSDSTERAARDAKYSTKRAARDAKYSTERAARDAKINAQRAADDAGNAVERTIDRID